jgi:hypothetical protein
MKFALRYFTWLLLGLSLSSCCSNLYYVNDPVIFGNVTKKANFNVAGGINVGTLTSGAHFNGSVAITNNLYVSAAYTHYSGSCTESITVGGNTTNDSTKYSGNSILTGIGYYTKIGKNLYFEGLLGGKYGNNANRRATENFEYRHMKYFIQPGIAYTAKNFQAGLALRFGIIDYLPHSTGSLNVIPEIATDGGKVFLDPAVYISGGWEYVKVGGQLSTTFSDNTSIAYFPLGTALGLIDSDPLSLSLFIQVTIPSWKGY